eukprot:COSAG02_NODE_415_length_22762_cov_133.681816_13_plen_175_part_00
MVPGRSFLCCFSMVLFASTTVQAQGQQLCPIQDLDQFDDIARICCESSTGTADCSNGFPTLCTRECAALLEPFWTACGTLVELLGDTFACDENALDRFAKHECHHTNILFEHAAVGICPPELLEPWTDDVNAACCEQVRSFADGMRNSVRYLSMLWAMRTEWTVSMCRRCPVGM